MRVLVTGSREFNDYTMVCQTLDRIYEGWAVSVQSGLMPQPYFDQFVLVHGACPRGADAFADLWAFSRLDRGWDLSVERHPADWSIGRIGGILRNQHMVNLGANLVVGFLWHGAANKGSLHCLTAAMRAGLEVDEYWSAPRIETIELPPMTKGP